MAASVRDRYPDRTRRDAHALGPGVWRRLTRPSALPQNCTRCRRKKWVKKGRGIWGIVGNFVQITWAQVIREASGRASLWPESVSVSGAARLLAPKISQSKTRPITVRRRPSWLKAPYPGGVEGGTWPGGFGWIATRAPTAANRSDFRVEIATFYFFYLLSFFFKKQLVSASPEMRRNIKVSMATGLPYPCGAN